MMPEQCQAAIDIFNHYGIYSRLQIKLIMMVKQLEHAKVWSMQVLPELTREQPILNMQSVLHAKFD